MDEEVYVQSVGFKMELPGGKQVFAKFMGLAICSPQEWQQMIEDGVSLADLLQEGESILFQTPMPLEKAIDDKKQYNDVVDIIREELRKEHHETLKEKPNEDTN